MVIIWIALLLVPLLIILWLYMSFKRAAEKVEEAVNDAAKNPGQYAGAMTGLGVTLTTG